LITDIQMEVLKQTDSIILIVDQLYKVIEICFYQN